MGQFGWDLHKPDAVLDFARIVQLGWAISPVDKSAPVIIKRALVRPSDFTISDKATRFHGISHAYASQEGRALQDVLVEFIGDVEAERQRGGRVCAHQLETGGGAISTLRLPPIADQSLAEYASRDIQRCPTNRFDAGIIYRELKRLHRADLLETWLVVANAAFCTMNSPLSWWVQERAGQQVQQDKDAHRHVLGLKGVATRLPIPDCDALIAQHHDAGVDAHIACLIYITVLQLAKAAQNATATEQGEDVAMSDAQ